MGITLPNPLTVQMGQAVQQAYLAFKQGSQWQPTAPSGWSYTTSISGWDEIVSSDGKAELFGLAFQATADASQVLIAFRGTDSKVDAYNDLFYFTEVFTPYATGTTSTAEVAKGFNGIYVHTGETLATSLQAQVFQLLSSISNSSSGLSQIYVTGHSLGAAIGELLAYDLALSLAGTPVTTITFAAPMVGIQSWGQAYDASSAGGATIRVVNLDDVVPNLPPHSISPNYVQVAQEFAIQFKGTNEGIQHPTEDLVIRHEMDNYLYVVEQAIGQSPQQWAGTFPDGVFVLKHGPNKGQPVTDESVIPPS